MLKIIKEFEGIIGALLGTISTLIVTEIIRKVGKFKHYLLEYNSKIDTYGDVGCYFSGKDKDNYYGYSIKYKFQVYNGYEEPQIMRDFKLKFFKNKKEIFFLVPRDETTKHLSDAGYRIDDVDIFNLKPKEIHSFHQSVYILESKEEINMLDGVTKVELSYLDNRDRIHKLLLSQEKIVIPVEN